MNWQIFVALRYLSAKRKVRFISLISLISAAGVAIGVASLIVVIGVMTGFDEDLKEKIIGTYSHIEIISDYGMKPSDELRGKILATPHVKDASFFLNGQVLIRKDDIVTGVIVKGIDPENEVKVSRLGEYIKQGSLAPGGDSGAMVGSELAAKLNLRLGDKILLVSPSYAEGKAFKVSAIFTSGMYEYDMNLVYVDLAKAQSLFNTKDLAGGAAIRVDDIFNIDGVKKALQEKLGFPYIVRTWADMNKNMLSALKLEKTVMFIILTLIVMVACFNIASTLIMTVLEKTKDIGILKAIGASNAGIMKIFALTGSLIGIIGTFAGAAIGITLAWVLKTYKFITLPKDIYYIDRLPVKIQFQDIALIVVCSVLISLVSTLYPARKASQLDPVEALRYE